MIMFKPLFAASIFFLLSNSALGLDFLESKQILGSIYTHADEQHQKTFYCNCPIQFQNERPTLVNLDSCGYNIREDYDRARRIEWEHIVPAYRLGHNLPCWDEGGRNKCREIREFSIMEGDMHNLVPVIGEINKDRRHYPYDLWHGEKFSSLEETSEDDSQIIKILKMILNFIISMMQEMGYQEEAESFKTYGLKTLDYIGEIIDQHEKDANKAQKQDDRQQQNTNNKTSKDQLPATTYRYGQCEIIIDSDHMRVQPPKITRGVIARATLYMDDRYNIKLSQKEKQMYQSWNKSYPADSWECRRNRLITNEQGNDNPYITKQCTGKEQ